MEVINDDVLYNNEILNLANMAKADGCTKTNPIIPSIEEFKMLFNKIYIGK